MTSTARAPCCPSVPLIQLLTFITDNERLCEFATENKDTTVHEQCPNGRRVKHTGTTKRIITVHTVTDISKECEYYNVFLNTPG
jgi:hypothetical protein